MHGHAVDTTRCRSRVVSASGHARFVFRYPTTAVTVRTWKTREIAQEEIRAVENFYPDLAFYTLELQGWHALALDDSFEHRCVLQVWRPLRRQQFPKLNVTFARDPGGCVAMIRDGLLFEWWGLTSHPPTRRGCPPAHGSLELRLLGRRTVHCARAMCVKSAVFHPR